MSRDDIRARLAAATPGPWEFGCGLSDWHVSTGGVDDCITVATTIYGDDGEFIAHAPDDLRLLLAVADAAAEVIHDSQLCFGDHQPVDQDGAIVCEYCGDWWSVCTVHHLAAALAALDGEGT